MIKIIDKQNHCVHEIPIPLKWGEWDKNQQRQYMRESVQNILDGAESNCLWRSRLVERGAHKYELQTFSRDRAKQEKEAVDRYIKYKETQRRFWWVGLVMFLLFVVFLVVVIRIVGSMVVPANSAPEPIEWWQWAGMIAMVIAGIIVWSRK